VSVFVCVFAFEQNGQENRAIAVRYGDENSRVRGGASTLLVACSPMAKVIMKGGVGEVSVECNIAFTNSYQITELGSDLGSALSAEHLLGTCEPFPGCELRGNNDLLMAQHLLLQRSDPYGETLGMPG
jgi:hypothetical protein